MVSVNMPAPPPPRRRIASAVTARRRRTAALVVVLALGISGWAVASHRVERSPAPAAAPAPAPHAPRAWLELRSGHRVVLRVPTSRYLAGGQVDRVRLRRLVQRALPLTVVATRARARITYRYNTAATTERARANGSRGGVVQAVRSAVAAVVAAPVVRQAQRNTCESAALETLLATTGQDVDQRRLQAAFPRSGPRDPRGDGPQRVWGDPDNGYVGRPDGGGLAGGFGIYPPAVRSTARRFGVSLRDLSGRSPQAVYDAILAGHAVMAWVGLSSGPYGRWRAPDGRAIKVNFGEHTVVMHGLRRDGALLVSNPLEGTRETWSKDRFERMWRLLGRRALSST